jgi:hypothetical protein
MSSPHKLADGSYCGSNFAAHQYDPRCTQCGKIRTVVFLRRKTVRNGCSQEEATSALVKATAIIETYKLKKGDYFDREYDSVMRETINENQKQYAKRPKRKRNKLSDYDKRTDEGLL